jgi:ribonuclease HI
MSVPEVYLFTDGSCPENPGPGGWAYILRLVDTGKELVNTGGATETTNNRMELRGVIEALKVLESGPRCNVTLFSDSQYVTKGISEWMAGWKKKKWNKWNQATGVMEPVKNADLWQEIDRLVSMHDFKVNWVRGHVGHPENERCDEMAGQATKRMYEELKRR